MTKNRSQSSTLPDSEAERGPAPIFTPILPPRITRTSHAALGDTDDLIVPIKNTFDEGLLRECVPDIDLEMAENLRMDLSESDVHERVIQYFKLCREIIEDHGRHVLFSLVLMERSTREDEVVLHDLILEKALDHEKSFYNQRRAKPTKTTERPKVPPTSCPHCGDKLRSQRGEKSKREVARLKRLRECIPNEEKTVNLNEVMELPYCADTGADRTAISQEHVRELMFRDPTVKLTRLITLVIICPVGEHVITCRASVNLRVLLNTAAGIVAIHEPVEFLVISDGEPEFILGQDVL
eukprot:jgi/Phyca11/129350/e_gw1.83.26.1